MSARQFASGHTLDSTGCREVVCWCHDTTAARTGTCTHCGCRWTPPSGAECHDCGTLTDSREADDAGRCIECAWRSARPLLDTFGEPVSARQLARLTHCHDERHETPCPLPCAACASECAHPLPKATPDAGRSAGAPARSGEVAL